MKRSENRPGDHLRDRQLHRPLAAREQKDLTPHPVSGGGAALTVPAASVSPGLLTLPFPTVQKCTETSPVSLSKPPPDLRAARLRGPG